jgi:3-dehydroquinate synthase
MGLRSRISDIPGDLPDADGLIALMAQDKKVRDGRLAFVLARDIGAAFVTREVDLSVVRRLLGDELSLRG